MSCAVECPAEGKILLDLELLVCLTLGAEVQYTGGFESNHLCLVPWNACPKGTSLGLLVCLNSRAEVQHTGGFKSNHVLCHGMPGRKGNLIGFGNASVFDFGRRSAIY